MPFAGLRSRSGYPYLEDVGLIGDGRTAALVGRDGNVWWLCAPRFDSAPLFCGLLDVDRGGAFFLGPTEILETRQEYEPSTAVLRTEMRAPRGVVRVTDAMPVERDADLHEDESWARGELCRRAEVLDGSVRLRLVMRPHPEARWVRTDRCWCLRLKDRATDVFVHSNREVRGAVTEWELGRGGVVEVSVGWGSGRSDRGPTRSMSDRIEDTARAWRRFDRSVAYQGPEPALVRRSAITLKLLDHFENGALVAAPTSSLPEHIGSTRNWDYRFVWVRDAAFTVFALRRIGLGHEAHDFLRWALRACRKQPRPLVLYDVEGERAPDEIIDEALSGYARSAPVRFGNDAVNQVQHDVYGEILDCANQLEAEGRPLPSGLWPWLRELAREAGRVWSTPDCGIWEVRSGERPFTYSAALCQVALDRASRLARRYDTDEVARALSDGAEQIRTAIVDRAWNPRRRALVQTFGGERLDASLLALPLRRVVPANHPRMRATVDAIAVELGAGKGLIHRYDPERADDGLPPGEGAFVLCSFWMVETLALQGRLDEAMDLFSTLRGYASSLGLLSEQIDPSDGHFLGNFPQAMSHVGLVASAVVLAREIARRDASPSSSPFAEREDARGSGDLRR